MASIVESTIETSSNIVKFHSDDRRVCCACGRIDSDLSVCTKCKVYRYCNRDCQAKHWKVHKKSCKAQAVIPLMATACNLATKRVEMEADDPDLDEPYRYIVVSPMPSVRSEQDFWRTARGVKNDQELDTLLRYSGSTDEMTDDEKAQRSVLEARYEWPNGMTFAVVPGYNSEYNDVDMYAFFDDLCAVNPEVSPNATAGYVLMKEDTACRGVVVFAAKTRVGNAQLELTRRDVLLLAEYNSALSSMGVVSSRIHFENIRRAESLAHLQSTKRTMIDL